MQPWLSLSHYRYRHRPQSIPSGDSRQGVSPWGIACEIVHRERLDIDLYAKDGAHPSYAASYLAAALTYLTIFHEPFKADTPARLDRETAAYLRNIAERVVLKR